ncbi:MAG TPA: CbiX/SirB N-terminal domain-containing protein [Streptosporangiaceae bacterium]|jgi:sirohydrochlorin ferrochelatase
MRHPPVTAAYGPGAPPLVAVAHGSRDPRAARVVTELLERVRERRPGMAVHAAFLDHMAPSPARVMERLAAEGTQAAVVLPLLLTAAYHSRIDLPGVLNRVRADHPGLDVRYGDTLGPDPALRTVLRRRLAEAGAPDPDPETAVVLTSAGSSDPRANGAVAGMADRMAADARAAGPGWHSVVPAYASAAAPGPAEAVAERRAAGARRVVVASYFLAPGFFADRVATAAYGEGAYAVSPVLGPADELAGLLLARYDAVGAGLRAAA